MRKTEEAAIKQASAKEASAKEASAKQAVTIRSAVEADVSRVIALDSELTGQAKPDYWQSLFERYGGRSREQRFFLVADHGGRLGGFIIGEVRAWEFGSPLCGWIFAIQVHPKSRLRGIGTQLFDAICDAFRAAGVDKIRTMLARDNPLLLSFFRSQGMMAGPFIQLELML